MTCVLHLGLPKTATTSLQASVFPRLADVALFVRGGPAAILEKVRYSAADAAKQGRSEAAYLDKIRETLNASLREQTAGTVLISNENVFGWHPDGPSALVRRIHHVCPQASAFIVLREPTAFLASIYRQEIDNYIGQIETGRGVYAGIKPFKDFISAALERGARGHLGFIHYNEIVAGLRAHYGERALILDFDRLVNGADAFVSDIVGFIGVPMTSAVTLDRRNVSAAKIGELPARLKRCDLSEDDRARFIRAYDDLELPANVAAALNDYIVRHAATAWEHIRRPS